MAFFRTFNLMSDASPIVRKYSNCKPPKWEHVLQPMAFIPSEENKYKFHRLLRKFSKREFFSDSFFSNFDVNQLPLTYGRMDLQRKFTFDFIPNDLYTPYVSAYNTCVLTKSRKSFWICNYLRSLKMSLCTDFHPQPRGFSEFQFQIIILAGYLSRKVWVSHTGNGK